MNRTDQKKYTKPQLRQRLKNEIQESDRGGRSGQWSARKAQLLVQEYERQGGGYTSDRKDEDAQSLEQWTDQDWQTAGGSAYAESGEEMSRYLPEEAWHLLSDEEKRQAEETKKEGDRRGKQHVENPPAVQAARAYVERGDASDLSKEQLQRLKKDDLYKEAQKRDVHGRSDMNKPELAKAVRKAEDQKSDD